MTGLPFDCCVDAARHAGEQLFGTAPSVSTWFLLEVDQRWEPKVTQANTLPAAVNAHLNAAIEALPDARATFIRQQPRLAPPGIALYVAAVRESDPALYRFALEAYEDLLALDLTAIAAGDPAYDAQRQADPIWLVCTHGRRDVCCARLGRPIYEPLAGLVGASAWQTSHVGGHRFAPNIVSLPHGVYYGWGSPERVPQLVEELRAGRIVPDVLRGRACYDAPVQVAEHFLRAATGINALDVFRLASADPVAGASTWRVQFADTTGGALHTLTVSADYSVDTVLNTGDVIPVSVAQYRLIEHDIGTAAD